ncbi:MAG TPA: hypothetical protein VLG67_04620 [Candidatus Saccharimonadales bacterium]|nr:hypothetical protein [Candidatus Saccharimonadales bacterium]
MNKLHNFATGYVLEICAIIIFPFSIVLGVLKFILPLELVNPSSTEKFPIVISEQWFNKNYWHFLMKNYLVKKGYKVYWVDYSILKGGIDDGAKNLQKFFIENDIKNAVLVGISYGAVSAFYYLQYLDGWDRVSKFISVAGPLKGTPKAYLLFFLKAGWQIFPNSQFIKKLVELPINNPEKILCISAKHDELVPLSSSRLPNVKNVISNTIGHNMLHMFSKEVFKLIAEESK